MERLDIREGRQPIIMSRLSRQEIFFGELSGRRSGGTNLFNKYPYGSCFSGGVYILDERNYRR